MTRDVIFLVITKEAFMDGLQLEQKPDWIREQQLTQIYLRGHSNNWEE